MAKFKKIYIEITNRCNLKCSFCSEVNKPLKYMNLKEFECVIKKIKGYTKYVYLHVKGEPLLHPQLKEILDICDQYEMKVNITSNGTLLKKNIEIIKNSVSLKKLNLSLHCEHEHPNYLNDIFYCVDKLKDKTVIYRLWTLRNHNLDEKSMMIVNEIQQHYQLSNDKMNEIIEKNNVKINEHIYIDKDNEFVWPSLNSDYENKNGYCFALKTQIAILTDGSVVPCCLDSDGVMELGNIFYQSLDEIISSKRCMNLRKSFQDRHPSEKLCQKCGFHDKN